MMRPRALQAALLCVLVLTLLCGIGSLRAWSGRGGELVMRGASDVRIDRRGVARLHITYRLSPQQTRHDLRAFLVRQGWRRTRFSNVDRETVMTFVRPGWYSRVREVLVITTDRSHREVDMQFGHCIAIAAWVKCL
jgi:hypothetical protein